MKSTPTPFVEFLDRVDYVARIAARRFSPEKFRDAIRYKAKTGVNLLQIASTPNARGNIYSLQIEFNDIGHPLLR
jgi:hypothetical protein